MSKTPDETPKVVGLFHRNPYVLPSSDTPAEPEVDKGAIAMLKDMISKYETGEFWGCIVLSGIAEPTGHVAFVAPSFSDSVIDYDQIFVGGCMSASHELLRLAEEAMYEDE